MPRPQLTIALLAVCLLTLATAASGFAAKGDSLPYRGLTDQDRDIKLIVDGRGRVKRGVFSAVTECSGRYKPFTGEFSFRAPLDRSRPDKFRDEGATIDSDKTFSGRYKWDIKGERKGKRKIAGKFTVKIVFRRNGRKFTTCGAEDVAYTVKRDRRSG